MTRRSNDWATARLQAAPWRKSRRSNPSGNCVEVAPLADGQVAMRNSRHPEGLVLLYSRAGLASFVEGAKDGEFDDLLP